MDGSIELRNKIIALTDEELLRVVGPDRAQYREQALVYAEAELQRRGLRDGAAGYKDAINSDETAFAPSAVQNNEPVSAMASSEPRRPGCAVKYEVFRGVFLTWDDLFSRAAEFASGIGPERLIGISHSEDSNESVVTVWYWSTPDRPII